MRVVVTGAIGFVGTWLLPELRSAGHVPIGFPGPEVLDIADQAGVLEFVHDAAPDAVVHLAGMAYPPDAAADAGEAIRVNVGGTLAVLEACRRAATGAALLVIGSAEVYAPPARGEPLTESSPLAPRGPYGLTKLAAEALALTGNMDGALEVAVARSFNHTGPGQRPVFAVPAFAGRILEARRSGASTVRAGNVDVARDIGDVRDVVRAYRLLIEALAEHRVPRDKRVYNVATGRAVTIRSLIQRLGELADWPVEIATDPSLVRRDDPPLISGDASALRDLTGWEPRVDLDTTLRDLLASLEERPTATSPS